MKQYEVIGPCPVADVEPGGTVTEEQLAEHRAEIGPLLGVHLKETKPEPAKTAKAADKP